MLIIFSAFFFCFAGYYLYIMCFFLSNIKKNYWTNDRYICRDKCDFLFRIVHNILARFSINNPSFLWFKCLVRSNKKKTAIILIVQQTHVMFANFNTPFYKLTSISKIFRKKYHPAKRSNNSKVSFHMSNVICQISFCVLVTFRESF